MDRIGKAMNLKYKDVRKLLTGHLEDDDWQVSVTMLENPYLSSVTNHPVHVLDDELGVSISSFIPFCWFGSLDLNTESDGLNISVCDQFKPKLRNDQVCYEIDPNNLLPEEKNANKIVLYFLIDQNKDRQFHYKDKEKENWEVVKDQETFMADDVESAETIVYLDTIGKHHALTLLF